MLNNKKIDQILRNQLVIMEGLSCLDNLKMNVEFQGEVGMMSSDTRDVVKPSEAQAESEAFKKEQSKMVNLCKCGHTEDHHIIEMPYCKLCSNCKGFVITELGDGGSK